MRYVFLLFLYSVSLEAQSLFGLHTQWDDDIKQWDISLNEGELEGSIEMTWRMRNDFTEWNYKIGDRRGNIQQKWDNNANVWELKSVDRIVTVSTVWSGDFTSWRVNDGSHTIKIERPYLSADPIEWRIIADDKDSFFWYNEYEYDIRDWVIEDYLDETYSLELKLAAVFISILHSL
ncbi:hypothetical protein [Portibacter marinus]|uniref:hypothetical protein n=1 Tax=Portibacter marinus TaxID=2898660 RepID=UPI001F1C5961|nr:hypothetical protein [Portibacter marinus]